ncbi:MAG: DUF4188 domain-containing protein [Microbacterium sp.]|uniref:DUF4188 domain-containing protein n=1 Tax=Microbacterium sp. TaxID=51671 RepID=UPI001ACAB6E7|nr:DUF4188 domain-containing protein [Microbacterium sp.]MBN9177988.1 DUF4188 domain-containing protein [Microbacterium sp.]
MAKVFPGRMTHRHDGDLVVFLIGMRINRFWRPDKWIPAALAMGPMLAELLRDPDSGLLGWRMGIGPRGPLLVQYWESHEKLYAYAGDAGRAHRPAWLAYYRRARNARGAVGVWHETYAVAHAESMYVAMPASGLAAATSHVPVAASATHARDRLADGRVGARD